MTRLLSAATTRNRAPILAELRQVLPERGAVLEVASGSGEHAAFFAEAMPQLRWRPSDPDAPSRESIRAWTAHAEVANVDAPLALDVMEEGWAARVPPPVDAVLCINMLHIAPWEACLGLLEGAATLLALGAPLVLYGPFMRGGAHTAPTNASFDASLRQRDARWGVRDLDVVTKEAEARGFTLGRVVQMPANNLTVAYTRGA